ncbi:hypothetical protein HWA77_19245 [Photobacterium damselae subsp. damselae]|uniref:Fimbrial protein n=1 Tax=Photobacterium damselae subsp. damselae TaxID=85581 RepID=A0A850QUP3_PHODD|nr:hypothetical protein [Photobacterium damselae subsp. damselae]
MNCIFLRKLISIILLFTSSLSFSYTLTGTLEGTDLRFKNVQNGPSGTFTIADWSPAHNLLPAHRWSPGFLFKKFDIILVGPSGKIKVDVSDAISVIGMEYQTKNVLEHSDEELFGSLCSDGASSANNTYVLDNSSGACHGSTYDSYDQMPFYFSRPLFKIDKTKIISAFNSLSDSEKKEGIYSFSVSLVTPYYFETISSRVETWRNVTSILNVSINYRPGYITKVYLDEPGFHDVKFDISAKDESRLIGKTSFNVNADGSMPEGLILSIPKINKFVLKNADPSVKYPEIPLSVSCPNCSAPELVTDGVIMADEVVVNLKGDHIKFPINVEINQDKDKVSLGDYYGFFVLNFSLNL